MKKILGLDLGTNSIGWALVNEAENNEEKSSIIKLGVRVNPLTVDEKQDFEKGKSITTNASRTLKRSMRRNLQRYKLRRKNLIEILKLNGFIDNHTLLSENGNRTTFETYRLRAKAVINQISLEEFARVLLMINKKRGYKSNRKVKSQDEGQLIDGMAIAKKMYEENLTPGELTLQVLKSGKKHIPDFYKSDLQKEFDRVWKFQQKFYPEILNESFKAEIEGKGMRVTSAAFWNKYKFNTSEIKGTRDEKKLKTYELRSMALKLQLYKEEVALVLAEINNNLSNSSGYLGSISDRSKELYFNKETVGQNLMKQLDENPNTSLKNQVFYRQDYLDEFNVLWEKQAEFHKELTDELKEEIRDIVIFYQRRLKSQKGLVSYCEFESREIEVEIEGENKTRRIGFKVCPKSSPVFQEFKIWQILNNVEVRDVEEKTKRYLEQEEKELLFAELSLKHKLSKSEVLRFLFKNTTGLELNYKELEGNRTQAELFEAYRKIIELSGHGEYDFQKMESTKVLDIVKTIFHGLNYNIDILNFNSNIANPLFEKQPMFQLWHLLYSFEGDDSTTGNEKLISKITQLYGFEKDFATIVANVVFQDDYSNLSTKAIRNILPYLKDGNGYSEACLMAGYSHSKSSLTKAEIQNKVLKEKLDILPKNSLRNPVVEKILNQMINVVNSVIDTYGKPDGIRIELARELKKSAKEREEMTKNINSATLDHEKYRSTLQKEFGIAHVSRNDIIRYKLYLELEPTGFHTLYSNTYITPSKIFSKDFDIEHIIPQSRMFDDSFSNKTLELRSANIEKGNETAFDFVCSKYGEKSLENYINRVDELLKAGKISRTKHRKLKMKGNEIPEGFISRDLRDTQYIALKAKLIFEDLVREVTSTSGLVTDRLREDWQLIDLMQELNWDKYDRIGMTEIIENRVGHKIRRINDWTKRNDHRHHAMDALAIAFTKPSYIQYLNNLNARSDKSGSIYGIETKELYRDDNGKLKFKPPMPLNVFRAEAKLHLENTLISIKAKNKVATININTTDKHSGKNKKKQLTPRGQLHLETVYGSIIQYVVKEEKVGSGFTEEYISKVAKKSYRNALLERLNEFDKDPKKAFTGKNNLEKNPIYLNELQTDKVSEKVKVVDVETVYTIRKDVSPDLKIDKVVDVKIKRVLQQRLDEYNGDAKKAFSNLEENPIWLNKEKGIAIKRVKITGISNAIALHEKKDKEGEFILDKDGRKQPIGFVNTGNNHHVAIYSVPIIDEKTGEQRIDEKGEPMFELQENIVSFFEAITRKNLGQPIIDKGEYSYKDVDGKIIVLEGSKFLYSMKQNEYFVFPNESTGFSPAEIDLLDENNYHLISPYLFRVQKIASKNYFFRHHLETDVQERKPLKGISYKPQLGLKAIEGIIKVRINHIGQIVSVGEY